MLVTNQKIPVVVTGIGLISALGDLDATWQRLIAGESGIKHLQIFPEIPTLPIGMIGKNPINFNFLTQLILISALKDASLVTPLPEVGVVIGSSRSYQGEWEKLAKEYRISNNFKSDNFYIDKESENKLCNWLDILPHQGAIAVARQIESTGPILAPMAACATGIWSLAQGFELIQTGICKQVITGAIESPITPLTIAGFQKMGALAKTGSYPFDRYREGLVLGEGGAIFILESITSAKNRGAKIYGEILGFSLTSDAFSATSPEPSGKNAIWGIKKCCQRSDISLSNIDYIHAHGTGTQLNDRFEANIIQHLFPQGVLVSSTKGATGHLLGASGALGVAFCLKALHHQTVPPCVGLKTSEFDINLVKTSYKSNINHVLCFSFGFGGQNAILALGKL
mgnify:CR=1 FL=1